MKTRLIIALILFAALSQTVFAAETQAEEVSAQAAPMKILPLGWGVQIFLFYPYTAFTEGDFGSSSFGITGSYNALVQNFWISVGLSGMIGSVFNMDLNVMGHYLFGDETWFASPFPMAGIGFGVGGPLSEGNPVYIQLLVGGGVLLLRNFTFQVEISLSYSFPLVDEARFESLSGLRIGIGMIWYIETK
ncbi:MAG: hypothetical protein EHM28_04075 [Spirochaetaceae bacterium]|nr:MAG: hypothetical protein EHM28_04075 [Spirochaetaceae bacterium]